MYSSTQPFPRTRAWRSRPSRRYPAWCKAWMTSSSSTATRASRRRTSCPMMASSDASEIARVRPSGYGGSSRSSRPESSTTSTWILKSSEPDSSSTTNYSSCGTVIARPDRRAGQRLLTDCDVATPIPSAERTLRQPHGNDRELAVGWLRFGRDCRTRRCRRTPGNRC